MVLIKASTKRKIGDFKGDKNKQKTKMEPIWNHKKEKKEKMERVEGLPTDNFPALSRQPALNLWKARETRFKLKSYWITCSTWVFRVYLTASREYEKPKLTQNGVITGWKIRSNWKCDCKQHSIKKKITLKFGTGENTPTSATTAKHPVLSNLYLICFIYNSCLGLSSIKFPHTFKIFSNVGGTGSWRSIPFKNICKLSIACFSKVLVSLSWKERRFL